MNTSDFDFDLPENLIAQTPLLKRSDSKLLVLNKKDESIKHQSFKDITNYFKKGDILVRNNTRVIPARLFGIKEITLAKVEVLLLKQLEENTWECLVGNAKVVKIGTIIDFNNGLLKAECLDIKDEGIRIFKMIYDGIFYEILETLGQMPLPPYINEKLDEKERYQTVYSKIKGSAAAPTAGLHFTEEIFDKLKEIGVTIVDVTLHVGLGTFKPVKVSSISEHKMHHENYEISPLAAETLNNALKEKRRIITVGTTSTRTLEANFNKYQEFKACKDSTDIFIYPGYKWQVVDAIITNFHLPKSTLIMMISSFATKELITKAYQEAITNDYRFFSFGDSMMIINE